MQAIASEKEARRWRSNLGLMTKGRVTYIHEDAKVLLNVR